jgi:hypothetical protein
MCKTTTDSALTPSTRKLHYESCYYHESSNNQHDCLVSASVAVTFDELVTTAYGTNIKIVGNNAAIGNWSPSSGVALSASQYTSSNPLWYGTLNLAAGTVLQYKYVKVDSSGTVTWEADPNHTITVPACASATTVSNSWQ